MPARKIVPDDFNPLGSDNIGDTVQVMPEPIEVPKPRKKSVFVPIDAQGNLDLSRVKDSASLDIARTALGGSSPSAPTPAVEVKVPRQLVPHMYDLLASGMGLFMRLVKFPRQLTSEQREIFVSKLRYSDEFKEKATEPTANVIDKYAGKSKVAIWLFENSDIAMLAKLILDETQVMFYRAAMEFNAEMQKLAEEQKQKVNGGYTGGSENRPPVPQA